MLYLTFLGIGIGTFISPNISSIMSSVPPIRRGVASGLRATFFNVGFVISLNLAVSIMTVTVPYSIVTRIISSIHEINVSQADRMLFIKGLNNTYLWLAIINLAAIPPSILRGMKGESGAWDRFIHWIMNLILLEKGIEFHIPDGFFPGKLTVNTGVGDLFTTLSAVLPKRT